MDKSILWGLPKRGSERDPWLPRPDPPLKPRPLLLLAVVALLSLPLVLLSSSSPPATGVVNGRLRDCPSRPNCVCSQASSPHAAIEPFAFEGEASAAFASLLTLLETEPRVTIEIATDTYIHAVARTRWLRFRDDLEFLLDPRAGVIQVRSASRLGTSDLGANRCRVESLRLRWQSRSQR